MDESWEGKEGNEESVVSRVLQVQEGLASMTELVQENVGRATENVV